MKRSEISRLCKLGVKYVKVSAVDRFNVFSNLSGLCTRYENMFFLSSSGHDCKKKKKKAKERLPLVLIILRKLSTGFIYYLNMLKRLTMSVTTFTFVTSVYGLCLRVWMSWIKHLLEDHLSSISTPTATGMIFVTVVYPVS